MEHRLEAVVPIADRVLLLDDAGRQVAFGTPDEVGREHARTMERLGSWVPTAWRDGRPADQLDDGPVGGTIPGDRQPTAERGGRAVLVAVGVTVRYPSGAAGERPPAIRGVDLEVRAGERVALVGPNGSGKSTLLFALAGLLRPREGHVLVGDGVGGPVDDPARLPAPRLARSVGLVFQNPELGFVGRTVAEEVAAGLPALGLPARPHDPAVARALDAFGLAHLADVDPFRLSEGEERRLSVAASGIARPPVLLLDEPTFALDRRGAGAVLRLLDRLRGEGQAQVLATHDPRLLPTCDRVVALHGGRTVFDGPPRDFLADPPYRPAEPWRLAAGLPDGRPLVGPDRTVVRGGAGSR